MRKFSNFFISLPIHIYLLVYLITALVSMGFPRGSDGEESACNEGYLGLIPRLGRSSGEGNGFPLQYSYLENSTDRGIWRAAVRGVAESDITEQLTLSFAGVRQCLMILFAFLF